MKDLFKYEKSKENRERKGVNEVKILINRLEELLQRLKEESRTVQTQEFEGISPFETTIIEDNEEEITELIETVRLPQQAVRHKKEIILQEIMLQISTTNLALKELKKEFVDRRKYCSKATFYRYVQELKKERKIEKIIINNEEFVYLSIEK